MKINYSSSFVLILTIINCSYGYYTLSPAAQLIYEFASKFRHINRISLLSCPDHAFNSDSHQACSQKTSSDSRANAIMDNFTLLKSLFGAKGVLIKVFAIDTLSAWWSLSSFASSTSPTSNQTENGKPFLQSDDHRQVVVLMLPCGNNSLKILQLASNQELFNASFHWLLIDEDDGSYANAETKTKRDCKDYSANRSMNASDAWSVDEYEPEQPKTTERKNFPRLQLIEFLSKLDINVNTELMLASKKASTRIQDEAAYILFDVWSPGRRYDAELNITEVGIFTQRNGLQIYDWFGKTTSIIRRMDMKNSLLRCMVVITKFMSENFENYLNHQHYPHLDSMHRYNFALLQHVRELFNFRFRLYRTKSWGYFLDGTIDGMIGALVRREVDIGGSPVFFRKERAEVIDYTARTWIARPCFMFRHPNTTNLTRNAFLLPFSNHVWMSIGACGFFITGILWNLIRTEGRIFVKKDYIRERVGTPQNHRTNNEFSILHNTEKYRRTYSQDITDTFPAHPAMQQHGHHNQQDTAAGIINFYHKSKVAASIGRFLRRFFRNFQPPTHVSVTTNAISFESKKIQFRSYTNNGTHFDKDTRLRLASRSKDSLHRCEKLKNIHWVHDEWTGGNCSEKIIKNDEGYPGKLQKQKTKGMSSFPMNGGSECQLFLQDSNRNLLQSCIFFFVGAICQQGTHYSCHLLSGRVVILSTLLFTFCISQFYSGTIVGTLLMEKPKTMKTIRDLIDSSLDIGIEDIGYNQDFIRRTTDPDAIELYRKKISQPVDERPGSLRRRVGWQTLSRPDTTSSSNPYFSNYASTNVEAESSKKRESLGPLGNFHGDGPNAGRKMKKGVAAEGWLGPEEGMKLMKAGGYAFHVDVATAYKIITETFTEQEICELTEIQLFPPQKMVGIVQKGSPLRKMITYGLRRTAETGLMDRQRKVWHSQKPRCIRQIQPTNLRVGMETFSSALFVLIFGLAASGVILALEVTYDLWHKRSIASKSPNIGQELSGNTPSPIAATPITRQREQHRFRPAVSLKDNAVGANFEFVN